MFDVFDNRDKCRKPGFLRGNIYTSCISMVLLDHFANKSNTFQHCLSPSLLPFPPWVSISSDPGSQDRSINGTLSYLMKQVTIIFKPLFMSLSSEKVSSIRNLTMSLLFSTSRPPLLMSSVISLLSHG